MKLIAILLAAITVASCGSGAKGDLRESEFITVTDSLTGVKFRCLYVDGDYASDMLCYRLGEDHD